MCVCVCLVESKEEERSKDWTRCCCSQSCVAWKCEWSSATAQQLPEILPFPGDAEVRSSQHSLFLGSFQYAVLVMFASWRRLFSAVFKFFSTVTEPKSMAAAPL